MILLCGIPSETPLRMVADRLDDRGAQYVMLNQREFAACQIRWEADRGRVTGSLKMGERAYSLDSFHAVYTRQMDDRSLPELAGEPPDSPLRLACRGFHEALFW